MKWYSALGIGLLTGFLFLINPLVGLGFLLVILGQVMKRDNESESSERQV